MQIIQWIESLASYRKHEAASTAELRMKRIKYLVISDLNKIGPP